MILLSLFSIFFMTNAVVSNETVAESLLQCQMERIIFSVGCQYCSPQENSFVMDSFYKLKTSPGDLLHPDNFTNFMFMFCPKYLFDGICTNFTSDLVDDCEYDTEMEEHLNDLTLSLSLAEYFCNWDKNILIENAEHIKSICMARIYNFNLCMKQIKEFHLRGNVKSDINSERSLCDISNEVINCLTNFGECQNHEVEVYLEEAISKLKMQLSCDIF